MKPLVRRSAPAFALACGAWFLAASAPAAACGFEDPSSVGARRGMLNFAFPDSLHVATAVWQAQLAGILPRDALAAQVDLSPEARAALRHEKADTLLHRLAARLGDASAQGPRPDFAIVLLGPVHWSRIDTANDGVRAQAHVEGPGQSAVVMVSDLAAIEAIASRTIAYSDATRLGLVRLYGPEADVAAVHRWLARLDDR